MKTTTKLGFILNEIENIDNTKLTVTMEDGKTFEAVIWLGQFSNIRNAFQIAVNPENNLSDEEIGLRPAKKIETIFDQFKREHNKYLNHKDDSWKIKSVEVA